MVFTIGCGGLSGFAAYIGLGYRVAAIEVHQQNQDVMMTQMQKESRDAEITRNHRWLYIQIVLQRMANKQGIDLPAAPE